VNEFGNIADIQLKTAEKVYLSICEYEKKIQQLQAQGTLARYAKYDKYLKVYLMNGTGLLHSLDCERR
jgi:hypothetical protein